MAGYCARDAGPVWYGAKGRAWAAGHMPSVGTTSRIPLVRRYGRMDGLTGNIRIVATLLVFFVAGACCFYVASSIARTFTSRRHQLAVQVAIGGFCILCALVVAVLLVR